MAHLPKYYTFICRQVERTGPTLGRSFPVGRQNHLESPFVQNLYQVELVRVSTEI